MRYTLSDYSRLMNEVCALEDSGLWAQAKLASAAATDAFRAYQLGNEALAAGWGVDDIRAVDPSYQASCDRQARACARSRASPRASRGVIHSQCRFLQPITAARGACCD